MSLALTQPLIAFNTLRSIIALGLTACFGFFLAGCQFAATQAEPVVSTVIEQSTFTQVNNDPEALASPRWWQNLNSPQLNQLVEQALEKNTNLVASEALLRAAQADLKNARAGLFPAITGNISQTDTSGSPSNQSSSTPRASSNTSNLQLSASYEIDLWSRVRALNKAAQFSAQASQFDLKAARISVAAEVASAWVQWVAARQTKQYLENELLRYQTNLKLVEVRFRQGGSTAADVLQQRQLVESTRGLLAAAKTSVRIIENSLTTLTHRPLRSLQPQQTTLPDLKPLGVVGLPMKVIMRRPDVQSAYARVQAANQSVAAAIANQYPQLSLSVNLSNQANSMSDVFSDFVRTLTVNLAGPLLDAGARKSQVDRQKALLDQAITQLEAASLQALQDIDNALTQEASQREVARSLGKQLTLAQQSLQRVIAGYRNGSTNYLNVLSSQQSTSQLERSLIDAQQQLLISRIALHRAISGGLPGIQTTNTQ